MVQPQLLFEVRTPLGWTVRTTSSYWDLIELKHPEVTGLINDISTCLRNPEVVYQSTQDEKVFLFYCVWNQYYCCAVAKRLNGEGFLITAYITDKIKEGAMIWPTST